MAVDMSTYFNKLSSERKLDAGKSNDFHGKANGGFSSTSGVPDWDHFVSTISTMERYVTSVRDSMMPRENGYLKGYVEGICGALSVMGWNHSLSYGFASTYLTVKYLDKYIVTQADSWKRTLSKILCEFYPEDDVSMFMDVNFKVRVIR